MGLTYSPVITNGNQRQPARGSRRRQVVATEARFSIAAKGRAACCMMLRTPIAPRYVNNFGTLHVTTRRFWNAPLQDSRRMQLITHSNTSHSLNLSSSHPLKLHVSSYSMIPDSPIDLSSQRCSLQLPLVRHLSSGGVVASGCIL